MDLKWQFDTSNINWATVVEILKKVNMGYHTPEVHQRAFGNSHTVVFVFHNHTLVGFGRAISDGEYQAAIYDVAVEPTYQGLGIGKTILANILKNLPNSSVILYASPGKEAFYEKANFSRLKTGMALFTNQTLMRNKGFIE